MQTSIRTTLFALVAGGLILAGAAPDPAWLDSRMPEAERALLAETEGHVLPALHALDWVGEEPTEADLKGKVVLIQSWSRESQQGRAVIRRVENLIQRSGRADDVVLITLHTPEQAEGAQEFIERRKPSGFAAIDATGMVCDALGIWKRPTTIVIDREGTIRCAGANLINLREILVAVADGQAPAQGEALASRGERDELAGRTLGLGAVPKEIGGGSFPPIEGTLSNSKDLRGKKGPELFVQKWASKPPIMDNKVVMIEFWATWCGPCIKGIPHLNELAASHRDELVVVSVSNEPIGTITQFMRKTRMDYHVGSDQSGKMARVTGHMGIPHAIVMSPDGIVRWQGHPATLTDATMAQIIAASGVAAAPAALGAGPYRWTSDDAG